MKIESEEKIGRRLGTNSWIDFVVLISRELASQLRCVGSDGTVHW